MKPLILALALACSPVQAQGAFSQSWNFRDTGAWAGHDSVEAGAIFAVFANIYTVQSGKFKHPQWVAVLITMGVSLAYEAMRWAEGKQPLALNSVYAGLGAMPVSFCFTIRF